MMYDVTKIQTAFANLVGWRTPSNPDYPSLTSATTTTDSGLYFQDQYPFLSIENMDAICEDFDNMGIAAYAGGTTYGAGDKVISSGTAYISLAAANTGKTPASNPTWWRSLLEQYLLDTNKQVGVMAIEAVLSKKKLTKSTKALWDQVMIFEGAGSMSSTVINEGRFVGLKVTPGKFNGIAVKLNYLGLQFTQNQTDLTIYVFHSSQIDPVYTQNVSTTKTAKAFQWVALTDTMLYYSDIDQTTVANQVDSGGSYFIGYYEDDITGQSIEKQWDYTKSPCENCNQDVYNKYSYNIYNKFAKVEPISVEAASLNGHLMWDIEDTSYPQVGNFGLNLNISVLCDITDILVTEKERFTQLVMKFMAVFVARKIMYSNRVNRISETLKKDMAFELKGVIDTNFYGLETELKREIDAVDFDMSEFNSPCFRQTNNKSIRMSSI